MRTHLACALAVLAAAAGGCDRTVRKGGSDQTVQETQARRTLAERLIAGWADNGRLAARGLIEKYGAPDEVRSGRLIWRDRNPWKEIVVRDLPPPYAGAKTAELGVLEQTVKYSLRPDQEELLKSFGGTLRWNAEAGELTARSDSEAVNFLRLNLADEVVNGRLTVQQARDAYARLLALEEAGKTTGYTRALHFKRLW